MTTLERQAMALIKQHKMIEQGNRIIVGLSGGADSVSLFHFLYMHKEILNIQLMAAHFNHGLRGKEADEDELFAKQLCEQYQVPFYVEYGNMNSKVMPKHLGEEAFARELRYAFFKQLAVKHQAKIALAHTSSDNAETILFRLARGTGPKGLAGIPPVRDFVIRPLLHVTRTQVEAYCSTYHLSFVCDSTNLEDKYARNRIRHHVLPQLKQINKNVDSAITYLSQDMQDIVLFIDESAKACLQTAKQGEGYSIQVLNEAPKPVRLAALALLVGDNVNRHILVQLEAILNRQIDATQIDNNRVAKRVGDFLYIETILSKETQQKAKKQLFKLDFITYSFIGGYQIKVQFCTKQALPAFMGTFLEKSLIFLADYDKINTTLFFRTRQVGDVFEFTKRNVTKTVKKWMQEAKMPHAQRIFMPLLADDMHQVAWMWGEGFCKKLQPTKYTTKYLCIWQQ